MVMMISEEQRAGKRSYGKLKQRRKKFPFSSRKITTLGRSPTVVGKKLRRRKSRLRVELMKAEKKLAKMKVEIRESAESLMASNIEANQTEARLEGLITTRNELMDNLLQVKTTEAFLMLKLGLAFL